MYLESKYNARNIFGKKRLFLPKPLTNVFDFSQNASGTNVMRCVSEEGLGARLFGIPQKCDLHMCLHNT